MKTNYNENSNHDLSLEWFISRKDERNTKMQGGEFHQRVQHILRITDFVALFKLFSCNGLFLIGKNHLPDSLPILQTTESSKTTPRPIRIGETEPQVLRLLRQTGSSFAAECWENDSGRFRGEGPQGALRNGGAGCRDWRRQGHDPHLERRRWSVKLGVSVDATDAEHKGEMLILRHPDVISKSKEAINRLFLSPTE